MWSEASTPYRLWRKCSIQELWEEYFISISDRRDGEGMFLQWHQGVGIGVPMQEMFSTPVSSASLVKMVMARRIHSLILDISTVPL